jgi:hypothetical protein
MDFPELNLKGVLYCGQCYQDDEVAASNAYRQVYKDTRSYYYLDQRHEKHEGQRQTVPSWLVHRLIYRTLTYAQDHREELLNKHVRGVEYKIGYTAQDRLDVLMSSRLKAIAKLRLDEIVKLDDMIRLELERQEMSYRRGVRICEWNPKFLQVEQTIPTSVKEFESLVAEIIPQIFVYEDHITIHTNFAMAFTYYLPSKPDKSNDVNSYKMSKLDIDEMFKRERLKQKYAEKPDNYVI